MVRAQAYTLEAFTAALLLIGAILFAMEVTAVTPLTASTSSQHIENQQTELAAGLLDAADENGSLRAAVLRWNDSAGRFAGSSESDGYYTTGGPPNTFGAMLNRTFRDEGLAFNVNVWYVTTSGSLRRERMVYFGTPSDHATSAIRTLTINDDDALTGPSDGDVDSASSFYAPDFGSETGLYNVFKVEVVVWRM